MNMGIAGAVLILAAWIPQTIISMKKGSEPDISFLLLYFAGTLLLFIHSISISDAAFTMLNGTILLATLVNISIKVGRWLAKGR